jgi:hypothetical protein
MYYITDQNFLFFPSNLFQPGKMDSLPPPSEPPSLPVPLSITGWSPPPSPPLNQPPLYDSPRNDFALAAFQTHQQLDRLVQAFNQHDLQQAFGFRFEQGLRLHVMSADAIRQRAMMAESQRIQPPRRRSSSSDASMELEASTESANIVRLEDTESDGSATPTPSSVKKRRRTKKNRKDKEKEKEMEMEQEKERAVVAESRTPPTRPEAERGEATQPVADEKTDAGLRTPPDIHITLPETPRALVPIMPFLDATLEKNDQRAPPELHVEYVIDKKEDVGSIETSEDSSKFVERLPSFTMTLTPSLSPILESPFIPSEDDRPIHFELNPPEDTGLPTPPTTASLLGTPLTKLLYPSDTGYSPSTLQPAEHPLNTSWTLYFSDTSDKSRVARKVSSPAASAEEYSTGLFTVFTASTLEDLLGGWKALRRRIASSKNRPIEPLGAPIPRGAGGLGLWCMGDDNNFHLFVKGVKPMWEDPMCYRGGKILLAGSGPPVSVFSSSLSQISLMSKIDGLALPRCCPPTHWRFTR